MAGGATLIFGGREFAIRPLTIGQLRSVGVGAARLRRLPADPIEAEAAWYDTMAEIIGSALARDYPEMDAASVLALEADFPRLIEANRTVMRISGLIATGEAEAATLPGVSSTGS